MEKKIIKDFYNKKSYLNIAKEFNISTKKLIVIWNKYYGKELTEIKRKYNNINKIIRNIVKSFYYIRTQKIIAKDFNLSEKAIRKIWKSNFTKEQIKNRKTKDYKLNREIIDLYYSSIPLKDIAKKYDIDERCIRKEWKKVFGKLDRKIISSHSVYNKKILLDNVYNLVLDGYNGIEISNILNIPHTTILKYINLDNDIYNKLIKNTSKTRSNKMKKMREKDRLKDELKDKVITYFNTNLFPNDISKKFNISPGSVRNIFIELKGIEEYKKRCKRLFPEQVLRNMKGLEKAGKLGSKPENRFYNELKKRLNVKVIHHDYSIISPYEIDITIPELKIAICWDGIGHFKPIFGEKNFNKVKNRDKYKRRKFKRIGWFVFVVIDLEDFCRDEFFLKQHLRFDKFLKKIGYNNIILEAADAYKEKGFIEKKESKRKYKSAKRRKK